MAQAPALVGGFELPSGPRLPRIGSVDAVALEERAATLAKRSIKRESKVQALELAVRMMDLTTLEGQDTPGKVAALCSKGSRYRGEVSQDAQPSGYHSGGLAAGRRIAGASNYPSDRGCSGSLNIAG